MLLNNAPEKTEFTREELSKEKTWKLQSSAQCVLPICTYSSVYCLGFGSRSLFFWNSEKNLTFFSKSSAPESPSKVISRAVSSTAAFSNSLDGSKLGWLMSFWHRCHFFFLCESFFGSNISMWVKAYEKKVWRMSNGCCAAL